MSVAYDKQDEYEISYFFAKVKEILVHDGNQVPFSEYTVSNLKKKNWCSIVSNTCMKLNYSIVFFYLEFLKISCRRDIVGQGQTTQTVQSDVGSTLSVNLEDVFLSKM